MTFSLNLCRVRSKEASANERWLVDLPTGVSKTALLFL